MNTQPGGGISPVKEKQLEMEMMADMFSR